VYLEEPFPCNENKGEAKEKHIKTRENKRKPTFVSFPWFSVGTPIKCEPDFGKLLTDVWRDDGEVFMWYLARCCPDLSRLFETC